MHSSIIVQNFNQLIDERCQCDVKHKLTDVLILIMCATLCGIDTIADIVEYGEQKRAMLSKNFGINKIPSESTVSRILSMVNAELLAVCIVNIMKELIGENGDITWNKTIHVIDRYGFLAHTYNTAVSALERSFIKECEFPDFPSVGVGGFFYFERMDNQVFLNEQINFFGIGVTIVCDV